MAKTESITHARVREMLSYDPETGVFHWLIGDRNHRLGQQTGLSEGGGGCRLCLDGVHYRAHRIAWFWVHGRWPTGVIDHINGDWRDNRIANLRDVSQRVNVENRHEVKGIQPNGKSWCSLIQVRGVRHYLGNFPDRESARAAYLAAKRRLHEGCTI